MIDLDNISTYPLEIEEWVLKNKKWFLEKIPFDSYNYVYKIIYQLYDLRIEEKCYIQEYIQRNREIEFTMWHNTRIYDK